MQEALKNADFSLSHIIISLCVIGAAIIIWMVFKRLYNRHVEQQVAAGGNRPRARTASEAAHSASARSMASMRISWVLRCRII